MSLDEMDIREQLPEHLMADPVTVAVAGAMAELSMDAREAVLDLAAQFSVVTATWALPEWERLAGVTPAAGATLEERRTAVIAKFCSSGTTNTEMIRALAESITGYAAQVNENYAEYEFSLVFVGATAGFIEVDADLIRSTVELIKPAHLKFIIQAITWGDLEDAEMTWGQMETQFPTWGDIESAFYRRKKEE